MKVFTFTLLVSKKRNYTPSSLMRDYTRRNSLVASYARDHFGNTLLLIGGVLYCYDHWEISEYNTGLDRVTVYLKEVSR